MGWPPTAAIPPKARFWNLQRILMTDRSANPLYHGERAMVYSIIETSEDFSDSLERQCRLNTPTDEDDDFEKTMERRARRRRRHQELQGTQFTMP